MDYKDRIKELKSKRKITNEKLSEMTGIPLGTLSKLLAGISDSPKLSNMVAICRALDCTLDYIVMGIPANTHNYTLDDKEIALMEEYRSLDAYGKDLVEVVMKKEADRAEWMDEASRSGILPGQTTKRRAKIIGREEMAEMMEEQARSVKRRAIYLFDMPVSAGTGVYLDETQAQQIHIPDNARTNGADFALRVSGNSMEPKFYNGDVLLVQSTDAVERGELGIFVLDGNAYFKVYQGDRLISLNSQYNDILLKNYEEVTCLGRVLTKLKRR